MKRHRCILLAAGALVVCAACANHDEREVFLLGNAVDQNIAAHSIREVDTPNLKGLVGGQARTAPEAESVLRDAKAKRLQGAQP
ncbi:MAG: hypothetical protein AAF486_04570 [Pseudomonadota bacterium]